MRGKRCVPGSCKDGWVELYKTRQDKTRQDRTRQTGRRKLERVVCISLNHSCVLHTFLFRAQLNIGCHPLQMSINTDVFHVNVDTSQFIGIWVCMCVSVCATSG